MPEPSSVPSIWFSGTPLVLGCPWCRRRGWVWHEAAGQWQRTDGEALTGAVVAPVTDGWLPSQILCRACGGVSTPVD
ncbi:hypothetical protein ACQB60_07460 [Actinomycetota bacterium Odt1-20B]